MRYMKQLCVILIVTCIGELIRYLLPFPIPGSIYGLIVMMVGLCSGIIKLDSVRETGEFLVEIMPLMFIPAAVGLLESWSELSAFLVPVTAIMVISTFAVMIVTGKVTDALLAKSKSGKEGDSNE